MNRVGNEERNGIYRPRKRKVEIAHHDDVMQCSINRMGCGGYENIAPSATALDPLTIAPGWTVFLVGDVGLTGGGGSAMTWADQSGNGFDATMSSAGFIPTQSTLLNGRKGITFDGSNDFLLFTTLDPPAPGTTPSWIFSVWNWKTWTSADNLYASTTSCLRLVQITSTPQIGSTNTTLSPTLSPTLNTWQCSEDYYSNSAADYLRIGASSTSPTTKGNANAASGTLRLGANSGGGAGSPDADMVCWGMRPSLPSAGEISGLRAWVTAWYGVTVAV